MRYNRFLLVAFVFELLLALGALGLGWLVGVSPWYHDRSETLAETFGLVALSRNLLWGLAATAPAVAVLLLEDSPLWRSLTDLKHQVTGMLNRLLCGSNHSQLFVLALLAGLGEELLFRGLLQVGLARLLPPGVALVGSLVIASVLFGLCHYLSHTYFLLATLAGFYFGLLMIVSGSIVPPILAHALYDFVALVYLLAEHQEQRRQRTRELWEAADNAAPPVEPPATAAMEPSAADEEGHLEPPN